MYSTVFRISSYKDNIIRSLERNGSFCYMPQLKDATSGFPPCSSEEQAISTHGAYKRERIAQGKRPNCRLSCKLETFDVSVRERLWKPLLGTENIALYDYTIPL